MKYALVIDGIVQEERNYETPPVIKMRDGKPLLRPIVEVTSPYDPDTQTVTVKRAIQNHKVVDTWIITEKPQKDKSERLLAALAAQRYALETGGLTVGDCTIQTDRESRATLIAARILAKEDANITIHWKTKAGFVKLNASKIIQVADAVAAFVQKCFAAEARIAARVESFNNTAAIVAAFNAAMAS